VKILGDDPMMYKLYSIRSIIIFGISNVSVDKCVLSSHKLHSIYISLNSMAKEIHKCVD